MSMTFTCVTEPTKKYLDQTARLLMSLRWFGGRSANSPFVLGCVGPLPSNARRFFDRYGADIIEVERYDAEHGPSNKVALLRNPALRGRGNVVLMDCDTVILQDPTRYLDVKGVSAKPADLPTVTHEQLQRIFAHYDRPIPSARFTHDLTGDPCVAYCNSGVVVIHPDQVERTADAWDHWNRLLLRAPSDLEFARFHVDQISLTMALELSEIPFEPLPAIMNMPTHLPLKKYPLEWHDMDPVVMHYHSLVTPDGYLKKPCLRQAGFRAEAFNARLRAERHTVSRPSVRHSRSKAKPKVIVGSGWWCDQEPHPWALGTTSALTTAFFDLWYRQVVDCIDPLKIVVTDSASPIKPDHASYPLLQWIELDQNYGHPMHIRTGKIKTKYSGFTRSVINGAMYALCCDADYYVYVEQDCLVHGQGFLEAAVGKESADILLGPPTENGRGLFGRVAAPMIQQSLMIVRKDGLERFVSSLLLAPWTDGEVSPEEIMRKSLAPFGFIQVPYGRSRPIDFSQTHLYAQHLTTEELETFRQMLANPRASVDFAYHPSEDVLVG